ncbi:MAG: hypothetical protein GC179_04875 [Anaerolineaceae bacterium]|nr:hypothetical protein [Anaerolineaceae bacterium]
MKRPLTGHPLYQRIITQAPYIMPWYMGCVLILFSPLLLIPGIVFLSAVYGLRWAVQIASSIANEREAGRYDLLVISPPGTIGIGRIVMSACLHRNESLEQTETGGTWLMRGFFTVVVMLIAASLTPPIIPNDAELLGGVIVMVYLLSMGLAMYIDHLHSIVLAAEVGILVPTFAMRRLDASAAAFIVYLVIQIATFVLTLLVGFSIAPRVLELLQVSDVASAFTLPILRLLIFAGSREVIVRYLWKMLVRETDATPSEVEFIR